MQISKITVARLYNLGSYEHVRYELTVDVLDGESAAVALIGVERIMEALNPRPLNAATSRTEILRKRQQLETHSKLSDEEFSRYHGNSSVGTRAEYVERIRVGIDEDEQKLIALEARAAKARKLLDDLGGAATWKDAKLDWEDSF
jgi:hypothetical protein